MSATRLVDAVPCREPGRIGVPCVPCALTNHGHGHPPRPGEPNYDVVGGSSYCYELRPETAGYAGPVWMPAGGAHRDPLGYGGALLDRLETVGRGLVTWWVRRGRHAR